MEMAAMLVVHMAGRVVRVGMELPGMALLAGVAVIVMGMTVVGVTGVVMMRVIVMRMIVVCYDECRLMRF